MKKLLLTILVFVIAFRGATSLAQVVTGTPAFGTFSNGPDVINIGNLNAHLTIPVLNKAGRGQNFVYNVTSDSSIYYPVGVSGDQYWTPIPGWGWQGLTNGGSQTAYISYAMRTSTGSCGMHGTDSYEEWIYSQVIYVDQFGTSHAFGASGNYYNSTSTVDCPPTGGLPNPTPVIPAGDGSGLTMYYSIFQGYITAYIVTASGNTITPPMFVNSAPPATPSYLSVDSNGNTISGSSGVYKDTTGLTTLTVTDNETAHTGALSFSNTAGSTSKYQTAYTSFNIQTNFGCTASVPNEYAATGVYLPTLITLPDNTSSYQFTYEPTPGHSGYYTGRIKSVTLPTGDTITYAYTGANNGITCADGSTSGLTRTLNSDAGSAAQTWTYARTAPGGTGTSHTEVEDGLGNHLNYDFAGYFETHRNVYEGPESGTPVLARTTCYNYTGAASPCTTATAVPPFSQVDTYETLNGAETHGSTAMLASSGMESEAEVWDFASGATSRGALMRKENWTYSTTIPSLPLTDYVYDGATLAGETTYTYDQPGTLTTSSGVPQHGAVTGARGNLTTETIYASASQSYALTATYEDTGSILTSVTPNGTTTLGYDTTFVYNTGTSLPTPASGVANASSETFDTSHSGLPLTSIDANVETTQVFSYDSSLRPTEFKFPDGGQTNLIYTPSVSGSFPNLGQWVYQTGSVHSDTETQYDGYGRQSRVAVANGQGTNPYYQTDSCYDGNGNVNFQSSAYQGTGWGTAKSCSGAGDTSTFDVLGRLTGVTHANGETRAYSYNGRAVKTVDEVGVTRISQVDGLGRAAITCEISSTSQEGVSPTSCGTDISGYTGFTSGYAYVLASGKTTVTQGAQTRIFQSDWLGRPTSVTEPESGVTTYSYAYNSNGLVVTRKRPTANQAIATTLTTTTTQYDKLGRKIGVSYTDGTPTLDLRYDTNSDWGLAQSNIIGRLTWADVEISPDGAKTIFSYDPMGRVNMSAQCRPSTCGSANNQMNYTYDWAGNMLTSTDGTAVSSTYTVSVADELLSLTSSRNDADDPPHLISSVQNSVYGPSTYSLGNGTTNVNTYDSLGRTQGGYVCLGSSSVSCAGGTQQYGYYATWTGHNLTSSSDTILNFAATYNYDNFGRLASRTGSGNPNYTYTYDRYGNRWAQTPGSGGYTSLLSFSSTTNQVTTSGTAYDAAGNMTNDGVYIYNYDAEGRIVTVKTEGGATFATYLYDALGHRIQTSTPSGNTEFVFNPAGQRVSIWNGATGAQIQGQYYWGSRPVAFYKSSATHFQHQDWEGTERARTTYSGSLEGTFTSLPFGDGLTTASGSDNDAYHYGMLDHDYESDTEHAQFRQYNSAQGHLLSPDPYSGSYDISNPQSFNRYGYALNNPLSAVDPSGLNACVPVSMNPGRGGAGSGGGMSPFCHPANYGTGDGVANTLLNDLNAVAATYGGPTSFQSPDGQTWTVQTDGNGNGVWVNGDGFAIGVNSSIASDYGAPFVPMAMDPTSTQSPYLIASNSAPNNGRKINGGHPAPPGAKESQCAGIATANKMLGLTATGMATTAGGFGLAALVTLEAPPVAAGFALIGAVDGLSALVVGGAGQALDLYGNLVVGCS